MKHLPFEYAVKEAMAKALLISTKAEREFRQAGIRAHTIEVVSSIQEPEREL